MSSIQETVRTRTITWEDPSPGAQAGRTMSGLDYLKAMQEGKIPSPPIGILMDMRIVEVTEGRVIFAAQPAEYHYNPLGTVHGGLAATLLDSALGCAIHSTLQAGTGYTTLMRTARRPVSFCVPEYSEGIHGISVHYYTHIRVSFRVTIRCDMMNFKNTIYGVMKEIRLYVL